MKRIPPISIIAFTMLVTWGASAQSDSLTLVTAKWQTQKIARRIIWKQYLFRGNLFGSNQNINILEVRKSKRISFTIGYESKGLKLTSEFGKKAGALAALNGTFFDTKEGGSVDFIKAGGQIINPNRMENNKRAAHQKAALAIEKGRLTIEKWNGRAEWETEMRADEIMVSGPLLLFQQRPEELDSSSFNITRHPRTAVAITASNRMLLITVDGRNENAAGMSLFELRNILRWLNARHGINLDGGGSTTLWICNQPEDGVVNYPCDNRKWDHAGERKVANALLIKTR